MKRNLGYFGEIRLDYKGIAHISGTARNDYSSTLSEKSYFYPSVTAGVIFSELFHISNEFFTYGKLRGNWDKSVRTLILMLLIKDLLLKVLFRIKGSEWIRQKAVHNG